MLFFDLDVFEWNYGFVFESIAFLLKKSIIFRSRFLKMLQKTETNTIRQSINYIFDKMNAFHSTLDNFNKYGHLFIFCFVLFFRSVMPTQIKQIMRFFDPLNKISIYYVEKYIV